MSELQYQCCTKGARVEWDGDLAPTKSCARFRLRIPPRPVGADERLGLSGPPRPPGIFVNGWRVCENWLDDPPLRIDDVLPSEEFAVASHRVAKQALVG